jgi:leucyl aminopeptidase
VLLGNYSFNSYKSKKMEVKNLTVYFYSDNEEKLITAIEKAESISKGYYFAKDLQNEPANVLTPQNLAERLKSIFRNYDISVENFDEKEIRKLNMGGLLAVGMGSKNPPRFIIIKYRPKGKKKKNISLIGKGITFDTGGISIKPAAEMWEMKGDMGGAAVIAGTILAAAEAGITINITGIIPAAENMLSGGAMRPGDIVTTYSGKSIEIDNTDAEGRIVLADALEYASEEKPDIIIDLATLTGACVVALGEFTGGLFTKDKKLSDQLFESGLKTYERIWPMPMWDDYHQLNKSEVADMKNNGSKWGGAISAAKFLENFVDKKIPWAHIDIAGPTGPLEINNYSKKLLNPFGVRLLFEYLSNIK